MNRLLKLLRIPGDLRALAGHPLTRSRTRSENIRGSDRTPVRIISASE